MINQSRWSLISAISGVAIAAVLVLAFEVPVSWAVIFVGVWIIAGAALRTLLDYRRMSREHSEDPDALES